MPFLEDQELELLGFRYVGKNVKISDRASIYSPERISIGDNSRIDDFCVLAGEINLGRNVHIAAFNNLSAGRAKITMGDFSGLAFGCHIVAQSDDYSGETMTNPTVPAKFKQERSSPVHIGRHVILGTGTIVLPGVEIGEGVSSGAGTLFTKSVDPWSVYIGNPARKFKSRSKTLLDLEEQYLAESSPE